MLSTRYEDAKREEGFTLIELLVVLIIIGILAVIAIPVFLNQRERAWVRTAESDARNIAIEVETYFNDSFAYPPDSVSTLAGLEAELGTGSINWSPNVTMVAYRSYGDSYCLSLNHELAEDDTSTETATYHSALGGIQDRGTACPAP